MSLRCMCDGSGLAGESEPIRVRAPLNCSRCDFFPCSLDRVKTMVTGSTGVAEKTTDCSVRSMGRVRHFRAKRL